MNNFFDGILFMSFCVAGFFFCRYWRQTHDRLFILFATGFWLMAVNRVLLTLFSHQGKIAEEHTTLLYLVRLISFCIILAAIIDKNRKSSCMDSVATDIRGGSGNP
jgi:hypothetical protein